MTSERLPTASDQPSPKALGDWRTMFRAFRRDFFHTGSIVPSSRQLGRELAANLRMSRAPARILEIGPGTGPVTREIIAALLPEDRLDVVEINGDFVRHLCRRYQLAGPAPLDSPPARLRILHAPIQDLPGEHCYDYLISGLPFNNFPIALTRTIWRCIGRLAAPGAAFSFFEYAGIRAMKIPFVAPRERKRLLLIGRHLQREIDRCQFKQRTIWRNIPPAIVHHLRLNPAS